MIPSLTTTRYGRRLLWLVAYCVLSFISVTPTYSETAADFFLPSTSQLWSLSTKSCFKLHHHMGRWCQIALKSDALFGNLSLDVITLPKRKYRAKLAIQPKGDHQKLSAVVAEAKASVGINGGYYSPTFKPVGLFKIDHRQISRFSSASRLLKAGIVINHQGQISLKANPKKSLLEQAPSAMQVGPVLIDRGIIKVSNHSQMRRRTLLAQTFQGDMMIIVTKTPASLYTLSYLLVHYPHYFNAKKIMLAVNLDGGSSTALSLNLKTKIHNIAEQKPVRTMILFYPTDIST